MFKLHFLIVLQFQVLAHDMMKGNKNTMTKNHKKKPRKQHRKHGLGCEGVWCEPCSAWIRRQWITKFWALLLQIPTHKKQRRGARQQNDQESLRQIGKTT